MSVGSNTAAVSENGPRIAPLQVEDLNSQLIDIILRMITVNQAVDSREPELLEHLMAHQRGDAVSSEALAGLLAKLPEIVRTMLRHPDLFARQVDIGIAPAVDIGEIGGVRRSAINQHAKLNCALA